jgi:hypothetical protein
MGDFHYFKNVRIYIQMAVTVGTDYFNPQEWELIAFYKDGTEAGRFKSLKDAAQKLGIHYQAISGCLAGTRRTAGGLMFMKLKDHYEPTPTDDEPEE